VLFFGYFSVTFSAVKKIVSYGPHRATLTELATGKHKGKFKITYRDASGKIATGGIIKGEAKAKDRAKELLEALFSTTVSDLTQEESRLIQQIRDSKIQPESLAPSITSLKNVESMTAPDATAAFLAREVTEAGYSYEQSRDYKRVLTELSEQFPTQPLSTITLANLEAWADGWKVGGKRYNNKRTILTAFFHWALARNYVEKNIAQQLPRKRLLRKSAHDVLTPKQFAKILTACPHSHIPWLALSGFAGLRGVEIYGRPDDRTSGLHWEDIDWKRKTILLQHGSAKKTSATRARLIPMCAALIDWLSPWQKSTGPVHPFGVMRPYTGSNSVTAQLGELIGGWKNNALRASRASYRLAETQSIATVTLEMGHSKDMLIGTYLNPRFEEDAATWFSLDKATAKALASQPETISIAS